MRVDIRRCKTYCRGIVISFMVTMLCLEYLGFHTIIPDYQIKL